MVSKDLLTCPQICRFLRPVCLKSLDNTYSYQRHQLCGTLQAGADNDWQANLYYSCLSVSRPLNIKYISHQYLLQTSTLMSPCHTPLKTLTFIIEVKGIQGIRLSLSIISLMLSGAAYRSRWQTTV